MKFSEMHYTRPDIDALLADAPRRPLHFRRKSWLPCIMSRAPLFADYTTAANLVNIHYTCDTRDDYCTPSRTF